jgi:HPt (histidine-containing phosphotransfer) domain-containing protein
MELKATLETWLPGAASSPQSHFGSLRRSTLGQAIDVRVLEDLFGDDPSVILEFLTDFRFSAGKIAEQLRTACANHHPLAASEQAHKLMSSARAMGALSLGELCETLETAGKAGRSETLAALLPMFDMELDAVNDFIDALPAQVVGH